MHLLEAYNQAMSNKGQENKVFDWIKAAILLKGRRAVKAYAGIAEALDCWGGLIYCNGVIVDDEYTYLSSNWGTPVILIDDGSVQHHQPCYLMSGKTEWNARTKWPYEARRILQKVA